MQGQPGPQKLHGPALVQLVGVAHAQGQHDLPVGRVHRLSPFQGQNRLHDSWQVSCQGPRPQTVQMGGSEDDVADAQGQHDLFSGKQRRRSP